MPVAALRRQNVHLPWILVEVDPERGGDLLALVDQPAHEIAEVAGVAERGEVRVVTEPGQRRDGVHGRVEDQLRPLRGAQVVERLRLQACPVEQSRDGAGVVWRRPARWTDPRLGVEHVLDVSVGMPSAAHEGHGREQRPVAVLGDDLGRADSVLHRHHHRAGPVAAELRRDLRDIAGLGREDHQVRLRQATGRCRRRDARREVGAAADTEAVCVERSGVLLAAGQRRHLGGACEEACKEAADHADSRNADARHADRVLSRNSRPPVRPDGRRMSTTAINVPSTITRVPEGRSMCQPRNEVPFSATARYESSALTARAPTTAPHRLVTPPITSIASVMNVRSRYTDSVFSGSRWTYSPPAKPARRPDTTKPTSRWRYTEAPTARAAAPSSRGARNNRPPRRRGGGARA